MKKVFALFLALLMVVSCMVILPVAAEDATEIKPWDGTKTTPEGTGREKDPYIIDSAGDLAWLAGFTADQRLSRLGRDGKQYYAQYASDPLFTDVGISLDAEGKYLGNSAFESNYLKKYAAYHLPMVATDGSKMDWFDKIYVKQVCDIDLGGYALNPIGNYWSNTQGKQAVKGIFFCGEYDGQGYTIKNGAFQGATNTNGNWQNGAMFGIIWGSTIKNINYENISVLRRGTGGPKGTSVCVGRAVSTRDLGYVYNISAYEKIKEAKSLVENITVGNGCTISGLGGEAVGGIVGECSNVTVKNCISLVQINVPDQVDRCGGIVGRAFEGVWIEGCVFAGHINYYENGAAPETHVGGILGSWTTPYSGADASNPNAAGPKAGFSMGRSGIVDCVNMGGIHIGGTNGTYCVGGILGATASLWTAGTDSTYTFENNVNLSTTVSGRLTRHAGLVGCFYHTNNGGNITETFDVNAVYNKINFKNCFNVSGFGTTNPGGYPLTNGVVNARDHGKGHQAMMTNTINYTGFQERTAVGTEVANKFINSNEDQAALDAYAADLYARWFDRVNNIVFNGAAGTADDPYVVEHANQFIWIALHAGGNLSNYGTESYIGLNHLREAWNDKYFVQTADVDMLKATLDPIGYYFANYMKDGAYVLEGVTFAGHYNGQGYAIKNVAINDHGNGRFLAHGLFGVIYGATLKNITVNGLTTMGNNNMAALVGMSVAKNFEADGTQACYSDTFNIVDGCRIGADSVLTIGGYKAYSCIGTVVGRAIATTVRNCYSAGTITNNGGDRAAMGIGGIVGSADVATTIENCISDAKIALKTSALAAETAVGGVIGTIQYKLGTDGDQALANSTVNTTATKSYVSVKNCVNRGTMEFLENKVGTGTLVYGGLIGSTSYLSETDGGLQIKNSYNLGSIKTPDGFTVTSELRLGGLIGCCWIAAGAAQDVTELINCSTVETPAISYTATAAYENENGEKISGKMNTFLYRGDRQLASGTYPIIAVNSSEVPMIATTEKELATIDALVADILNEVTKGVGAAAGFDAKVEVDDRDRLNVTFYAAIAEDVKMFDVTKVVFNITMVEDGKVSNYTMDYAGFSTGKTAPDGYNVIAEYTLPVGKKADATLDFTFTATVYTVDGAVRNGYVDYTFTVVNGVIVD